MNGKRKNQGFMMIELLMVVAFTTILTAVGFVAFGSYLRSSTKLQYDGYAKEIFVAAQNHLTMAASQNYLGRSDGGSVETASDGSLSDIYYIWDEETNNPRLVDSDGTVLNLMLPVGAVDETVRRSGSYLIRWSRALDQVMDVFYWSVTADRYSYTFSTADYPVLLASRNNSSVLEKFGASESVIGYYGEESFGGVLGSDGRPPRGETLNAPKILVTNGDRLEVTVTYPGTLPLGAKVKLLITGVTSRTPWEQELTLIAGTATVVLDDVTTGNAHFYNKFCSNIDPNKNMIPGEDIRIQAVAYDNTRFTNVAYSSQQFTNSLFGSGTSTNSETAKISNIRHLENLNKTVSKVNNPSAAVQISKADQTTDLDWTEFFGGNADIFISDATDAKATHSFLPVTPGYVLDYRGGSHSISKVKIDQAGKDAGLFGTFSDGSVSNLRLIDFNITDGKEAGALAGVTKGTAEFTNVLAYNSIPFDQSQNRAPTINGTGSTGGLVGSSGDCTFNQCAAALVVTTTGSDAGGLIGTANVTTMTGCFSGGHTINGGEYEVTQYNVTGAGNVGGLVGSLTGGSIVYSYSTCSASGATAGGLIGSGDSSAAIQNSYVTGLVKGTTAFGAFAGSFSGTATDCKYYEIVNEFAVDDDPTGAKGYGYRGAVNDAAYTNINAFDADAAAYDTFVGSDRIDALVYDRDLNRYYRAKFPFKTVEQIGGGTGFVSIHYGDWPAPEKWVVNR